MRKLFSILLLLALSLSASSEVIYFMDSEKCVATSDKIDGISIVRENKHVYLVYNYSSRIKCDQRLMCTFKVKGMEDFMLWGECTTQYIGFTAYHEVVVDVTKVPLRLVNSVRFKSAYKAQAFTEEDSISKELVNLQDITRKFIESHR